MYKIKNKLKQENAYHVFSLIHKILLPLHCLKRNADMAQLVEQFIRNE